MMILELGKKDQKAPSSIGLKDLGILKVDLLNTDLDAFFNQNEFNESNQLLKQLNSYLNESQKAENFRQNSEPSSNSCKENPDSRPNELGLSKNSSGKPNDVYQSIEFQPGSINQTPISRGKENESPEKTQDLKKMPYKRLGGFENVILLTPTKNSKQ
jgi:NADH:ubiquinone oxidoreductase subunit D